MTQKICLIAALLLVLSAVTAFAQGPTCNAGQAQGQTERQLAFCISQASQSYDINYDVTCDCPGGGITVNVYGAPRCNPNEPCPQFLVLVGTANFTCDYNLISDFCFFMP